MNHAAHRCRIGACECDCSPEQQSAVGGSLTPSHNGAWSASGQAHSSVRLPQHLFSWSEHSKVQNRPILEKLKMDCWDGAVSEGLRNSVRTSSFSLLAFQKTQIKGFHVFFLTGKFATSVLWSATFSANAAWVAAHWPPQSWSAVKTPPVAVTPSPPSCYLSSLCDELRSVELGHHTLQNFINDGRQNALIIIQTQLLVEGRQVGGQRPREDAQSDVHHLQVWWEKQTFRVKKKCCRPLVDKLPMTLITSTSWRNFCSHIWSGFSSILKRLKSPH